MSSSLITRTTSRVEHLAAWAYDRTSTHGLWDTGRNVPLCGQERNHGLWSVVSSVTWQADPGLKRKPLCRRCEAALEDLTCLAETKGVRR